MMNIIVRLNFVSLLRTLHWWEGNTKFPDFHPLWQSPLVDELTSPSALRTTKTRIRGRSQTSCATKTTHVRHWVECGCAIHLT